MTKPTKPIKTGVAIEQLMKRPKCEICGGWGFLLEDCPQAELKVPCPGCGTEQPNAIDKPELETLDYKPENANYVCDTCKDEGVLVQLTETANIGIIGGYTYPCPDCTPEQPNQNLMLLEQADNCIKVTLGLLEQLKPKTEQVEGCIATLKSWQENNLKHLKGAFE